MSKLFLNSLFLCPSFFGRVFFCNLYLHVPYMEDSTLPLSCPLPLLIGKGHFFVLFVLDGGRYMLEGNSLDFSPMPPSFTQRKRVISLHKKRTGCMPDLLCLLQGILFAINNHIVLSLFIFAYPPIDDKTI